MSKITVSAKLAKELDSLLGERGLTKDELLYAHIKKDFLWGGGSPLNDLTGLELSNLLINGYEAEKTPKEKAGEFIEEYEEALANHQSDFFRGRAIGAKTIYWALTREDYE